MMMTTMMLMMMGMMIKTKNHLLSANVELERLAAVA